MSLQERYARISTKKEADYTSVRSEWQYYWQQGLIDSRLEAGDQGLGFELIPNMPTNNIYNWFFNHTRPLCNMISGHQRNNRKSSIIVPVYGNEQDQQTADQWTKIIMNTYQNEGVYEIISEAFHKGALISGLNFIQVYLDFSNDPINGDLKYKRHSFASILTDVNFHRLDLMDSRFMMARTYMSAEQACGLLPSATDDILSLNTSAAKRSKNTKFEYMPQAFGNNTQNLLAYDEYYYRTYRDSKKLIDTETLDILEIEEEHDPEYVRNFLQNNPSVKIYESQVPTVRLAISVQDRTLWEGPQPLNIDCYPFTAVVGFFNPELSYLANRLQSVCRSARDPQILFNRRLILNAEIAESTATSGFIFKEEAIVDIKHLFNQGPGRFIPVKKGSAVTDIVPIPLPNVPDYNFQIQEFLSNEIFLSTGANQEMMGISKDDTIAGILSAMRQSAGVVTLQVLFDNLDRSQTLLTELSMKVIKANYTPVKIRKILGGEEPLPHFYSQDFSKYRASVQEGFMTATQKQLQFAQLWQLKQAGLDIPESALIEAATIQNKNELIKQIEQRQQEAQQQQQLQMQQQQQLQQAQSVLAYARAGADRGLQLERESRVPENRALAVERIAQAQKDHEIALLNKVKMLKEIEEIDISALERLVTLANLVKSSNVSPSNELAQDAQVVDQLKGVSNDENQSI